MIFGHRYALVNRPIIVINLQGEVRLVRTNASIQAGELLIPSRVSCPIVN